MAISTGRLVVGERLPTVRQLAVELRVNANTVAKVYGELERQGVLETRRGVGTFVAQRSDPVVPRAEIQRRLAALADRYLAGAAELGVSVADAIHALRKSSQHSEHSHAEDRDHAGA
jgi:GntR family transcriptional regulator